MSNKDFNYFLFFIYFEYIIKCNIFMGIGDWGLGIGDWGLGIGPNPQSPFHLIIENIS
jgi:hypothetical protein